MHFGAIDPTVMEELKNTVVFYKGIMRDNYFAYLTARANFQTQKFLTNNGLLRLNALRDSFSAALQPRYAAFRENPLARAYYTIKNHTSVLVGYGSYGFTEQPASPSYPDGGFRSTANWSSGRDPVQWTLEIKSRLDNNWPNIRKSITQSEFPDKQDDGTIEHRHLKQSEIDEVLGFMTKWTSRAMPDMMKTARASKAVAIAWKSGEDYRKALDKNKESFETAINSFKGIISELPKFEELLSELEEEYAASEAPVGTVQSSPDATVIKETEEVTVTAQIEPTKKKANVGLIAAGVAAVALYMGSK